LGRVAWGGKGPQRQAPEVQFVPIAEVPGRIFELSGSRGNYLGTDGTELVAARYKGGVQVGLYRVSDREPSVFGDFEVGAGISRWIYNQSAAVAQIDHVGRVAQTLVHER